eukprot:2088907-Karenia_brevis.AAC.1
MDVATFSLKSEVLRVVSVLLAPCPRKICATYGTVLLQDASLPGSKPAPWHCVRPARKSMEV